VFVSIGVDGVVVTGVDGVVVTGVVEVVVAAGGLRILAISACKDVLPVSTVGPLTVDPPLSVDDSVINAANAWFSFCESVAACDALLAAAVCWY
jgi:hypothetical protein